MDKNKKTILLIGAAVLAVIFILGGSLSSGGDKEPSHEGEAQIPSESMKFKNYEDVEEIFKQSGFTNIKLEKIEDLIIGWLTKDGEVEEVSVAGKVDYTVGEWVPVDTKVVIRYHTFSSTEEETGDKTETKQQEEREKETVAATTEKNNGGSEDVFYSTNSAEKAKEGNSGVFSYKSKGGSYDNYYLIDFDEGYVYSFSEGNGEEICDRIKIVSGNLNDVLIITYHDGATEWSYGLHFKWKRQPDHLVVQDEDGFTYDFYYTDLDEALQIRDNKTIIDY